ncbi:MAG: hypothetical protein D6711_12415 [Chloroflexi bacterium]|nr:MAG: hypothetical protein D6711_12415 [Chloroflexota bacterium]
MPYVHTIQFPVRHYECDANGNVQHAVYLGYMQEAAFAGSAAVGYSAQRYADIGLHWLAYETDLEHYTPLRYGDTVTIKTWVADFRRVRSLRQYELYRDNELVARAATDWVLIDTNAMYPVTIPPEIIEAYSRGEAVTQAPRRDPLPAPPPPPDHVFSVTRRVEWRDIDPAQHVNNGTYLHYIADCAVQVAQHYGVDPSKISTQRYQIEYKNAATLGDQLTISTWLSNVNGSQAIRHYLIKREEKIITRIRTQIHGDNLEVFQENTSQSL